MPWEDRRRISRRTASYFASTRARRSSETRPIRWPIAHKRWSALSWRSRRRYHQLFIEPMGLDTEELYIQGFSSAMPEEVQLAMLHTIAGLELRCGR